VESVETKLKDDLKEKEVEIQKLKQKIIDLEKENSVFKSLLKNFCFSFNFNFQRNKRYTNELIV
jgi:predicted RNase H-like nuclease (RuvC/YqgF family)